MKILIRLLPFILLASCSELVRTQIGAPEITMNKTEIPADGISNISFDIKFDRIPTSNQQIRISTSSGNIQFLPISQKSNYTKDTTFKSKNQHLEFKLYSSIQTEESVFVSVGINDLISTKVLKFTRSCPDEIQIQLNKKQVEMNNDSIKVTLSCLRNDGNVPSTKYRVDFSVDNNDIAEVTPTAYSNEEGKAYAYIKPLSAGKTLLRIKSMGECSTHIDSTFFEIK